MTPVLELKRATKEFHGNPAIKNIDFCLMLGEIHAILGENGAGKSTLNKVFAGVHKLTSGEMLFDGVIQVMETPAEALQKGIAMVFQESNLVGSMRVAQNIFLGSEKTFNRLRGIYIEAQIFLGGLGFEVDPEAFASSLGAAKKQMVEIARAVYHKARVIIFDEPTAALTPEEKHRFFDLVRRLKKQGVSIIFVTHALEEALQVADRITVLRDGELIVTDAACRFDREKIVQAMVGRSLSQELYHTRKGGRNAPVRPRGPKILSVDNLSKDKVVRSTSFSVYGGQVTGMFGLVGSGRSETMKIVCGAIKRDMFYGGEILLNNKPIRYRTPRAAINDGVVYVTEDRKVEGFFETMTIAENIQMGSLARRRNAVGFVSINEARKQASYWIEALDVKSIDPDARIIELSGGNQQKVVIAKSLIQKPRVVILDEPTRGVDVGAIVEIHKFINILADEGIAVVVISSYLPEILALSDRILVWRQGRVVEEMRANDASEERIMYAAVH